MVGRVRAAGAVVVGKTNVPEFGAGANSRNPVWGATGNPFNPDAQSRRLVGRLGGGARHRHAAGLHRLRHRRLAAHSRRHVRRGGLPPLARHGRGRAPRHGLDADLGAGPDGPHGRRHLPALRHADRPARFRSAQSFPIEADAFAEPWPVDLGSLRVAYTEDFGGAPVEKGIRQTFRDKIKAMKHLFRRVDKVESIYGERRPLLRRDPRRELRGALQRRLHQEQASCSGPTSAPTTRSAPSMTLADFAWAHAEQTRIFRTFQELYKRLRPGDGPDGRLHAVPVEAALCRGDGRQEARATTTTGWRRPTSITLTTNPGDRRCPAASTTRRCRSACR